MGWYSLLLPTSNLPLVARAVRRRDAGVALLAEPLFLAVTAFAEPNAGRRVAAAAVEHHVGDVQRRFHLDDARLPRASLLQMPPDDVHALDDDAVFPGHVGPHAAPLPLVLPGDDHHFVPANDLLGHSTLPMTNDE